MYRDVISIQVGLSYNLNGNLICTIINVSIRTGRSMRKQCSREKKELRVMEEREEEWVLCIFSIVGNKLIGLAVV